MDVTVPMFLAGNLFPAPGEKDKYVRYDHPDAPEYARRHLEQVRQPIKGALSILAFHGEDVAEAAEKLKAWIDVQVDELTR